MDFSLTLSSPKNKLIELAINYTDFPKYLPDQIKSVEIIEKTSSYTITEESLHLSSVISKSFVQRTKHYVLQDNLLKSEILSGPAKGSVIELKFSETENGTSIFVKVDVKLGLQYKFLLPLIKKSYKTFLMGILYKMHAIAMKTN
ncbi:MAG: hypothetical protein H8E89_04155 [Candidatus Nitrosopelagicus sp.]|nr:hypothetical protein [Candidatus Nitrosopelagicus sp.]